MKITDDSLRNLWDNIKCTNIQIIGVPEEGEKERVWENFWRDYSWKFPQHGKGNSQSSPRNAKSPIQDKHAKTCNNQINKKLKSRDITLPSKFCLVKAMVFPVVMYGCESWIVKKAERWRIDVFWLWWCRRLLSVPWTARRSNQSILKINPGC